MWVNHINKKCENKYELKLNFILCTCKHTKQIQLFVCATKGMPEAAGLEEFHVEATELGLGGLLEMWVAANALQVEMWGAFSWFKFDMTAWL